MFGLLAQILQYNRDINNGISSLMMRNIKNQGLTHNFLQNMTVTSQIYDGYVPSTPLIDKVKRSILLDFFLIFVGARYFCYTFF